jgi:hypothetical protein
MTATPSVSAQRDVDAQSIHLQSIPDDPEKDFEPIANAFINTQVMVVS